MQKFPCYSIRLILSVGPWKSRDTDMDHLYTAWQQWFSLFGFLFHFHGVDTMLVKCMSNRSNNFIEVFGRLILMYARPKITDVQDPSI